jgi:hypothetical protein
MADPFFGSALFVKTLFKGLFLFDNRPADQRNLAFSFR